MPLSAEDLAESVHRICAGLDRMMCNKKFRGDLALIKCFKEANKLREAIQGVLPLGVRTTQPGQKAKARGTVEELVWYAKQLSLPASDGSWFFDKMLQFGWKVNGQDVRDWKAVMRNWQRIGCMASQKIAAARANGQAPQESLAMKQTRRLFREIDNLNLP